MKTPLILISGPSASGKTTLSHALAREFEFPCLSLDDFFIRGARSFVTHQGQEVRTFERPELYDGHRLSMQLINRKCGFIAEGFCLFAYPAIVSLPAYRFYLDLPFETTFQRRQARRPRRPSDKSFMMIGRQETADIVEPQKSLPGVTILDGLLSTAELVDLVKAHLLSRRAAIAAAVEPISSGEPARTAVNVPTNISPRSVDGLNSADEQDQRLPLSS